MMNIVDWTETTFDESQMTYFDRAEADYPTRIMCKALAVDALGGLEQLCKWVELLPPAGLGRLLEATVENYLTYKIATALFQRLARWARARRIPTASGRARVKYSHPGLQRTA